VTDCLETLDELGNEGREQFEAGGGHSEHFHLAACLNDHPQWIETMAVLVRQNSGGWVDEREDFPLLQTRLEETR
jgi:ferrochelatase